MAPKHQERPEGHPESRLVEVVPVAHHPAVRSVPLSTNDKRGEQREGLDLHCCHRTDIKSPKHGSSTVLQQYADREVDVQS